MFLTMYGQKFIGSCKNPISFFCKLLSLFSFFFLSSTAPPFSSPPAVEPRNETRVTNCFRCISSLSLPPFLSVARKKSKEHILFIKSKSLCCLQFKAPSLCFKIGREKGPFSSQRELDLQLMAKVSSSFSLREPITQESIKLLNIATLNRFEQKCFYIALALNYTFKKVCLVPPLLLSAHCPSSSSCSSSSFPHLCLNGGRQGPKKEKQMRWERSFFFFPLSLKGVRVSIHSLALSFSLC